MNPGRLCAIFVLVLFCAVASSDASENTDAKWALHFAGDHNPQDNTCALHLDDCSDGTMVTRGPGGVGRYDIFVVAIEVSGISATRYGLCCEGSFFFYGWTSCSVLEIPEAGWPGCGTGNAQTWSFEQPGPHVTAGVLDVYVYGTSRLATCTDPRTGTGEWCDGSSPSPICNTISDSRYFGSVGFGQAGYNPCGLKGNGEETTWGRLKSMYRK